MGGRGKKYDISILDNDTSKLSEKIKKQICQYTSVELFELFFTTEIKKHIIDATKENDLELSLEDLNTFIGILLISSYNIRKNQRDYWSNDTYLKCEAVSSAMSRNKFLLIKSKLKYWTNSDQNDRNANDKAWRVRSILNIFRQNSNSLVFFQRRFQLMK